MGTHLPACGLPTVALAFEQQIVAPPGVPMGPQDVPVDAVATHSGLLLCSAVARSLETGSGGSGGGGDGGCSRGGQDPL